MSALWTNEVLYGNISGTHPVNWGIVVEFAENTSLCAARAKHGTSNGYHREDPIIIMDKGIKFYGCTKQGSMSKIYSTLT